MPWSIEGWESKVYKLFTLVLLLDLLIETLLKHCSKLITKHCTKTQYGFKPDPHEFVTEPVNLHVNAYTNQKCVTNIVFKIKKILYNVIQFYTSVVRNTDDHECCVIGSRVLFDHSFQRSIQRINSGFQVLIGDI